MRYGDLIQQLDEAFSPADLLNAERWIKQQFSNISGINVSFSPHFKIRSDARTANINLDTVKKIFAYIAIKHSLDKAFQLLSDTERYPGVNQKSRVLDFNTNGLFGSIFVNRLGQNQYEFETFVCGKNKEDGYLKKTIRLQSDYDQFRNPNINTNLAYSVGNIKDGTLIDLIRDTRETNEPNTNSNKFGYDYNKRLSHNVNSNVFQLSLDYAETLIQDLAFNFYKELPSSSKHGNEMKRVKFIKQTFNLINSRIVAANRLVQILSTSKIVNNEDKEKAISLLNDVKKELEKMKRYSHFQLNDYFLQQTNVWKFKKDIKKYTDPLLIIIKKSIQDKFDSFTQMKKSLKPFAERAGFSDISEYIKNFNSSDEQKYPRETHAIVSAIQSYIRVFTDVVTKEKLLNNAISQGQRLPDDLGVEVSHTVNPNSGNLIRANAQQRRSAVATSNSSRTLANRPLMWLNQAVKGLLRNRPDQNNQQEAVIRSILDDLSTAIDMGENDLVIEELTKLVAQYKNGIQPSTYLLKQFAQQKQNLERVLASTTETTMNEDNMSEHTQKHDIQKYVDILIDSVFDPKLPSEFGMDDDGEWWDPDPEHFYNPLDEIPEELHNEAKIAAFNKLLSMVRENPDIIQDMHGLHSVSWIPDKIRVRMSKIRREINNSEKNKTTNKSDENDIEDKLLERISAMVKY
jgi:hypothetical protein